MHGAQWDCLMSIWKWFCNTGESWRKAIPSYVSQHLNSRFCTLFVIAFPLGPLFALINNIVEIRLDARKFLLYFRRPVPRRVADIGIWYQVMSVISRISVLTSAFISK